ncbi:MAG TPA: bile acid:sodium symporter family protein [Caulobacteraceae bacterium]|jgi:sodium/bile acid cotransporter 7
MFLIASVVLASVLPCRGVGAVIFGWITNAAIILLFFLHGAKLSREAVLAGIGHWRLHLLVALSTFVLFPALGLLIRVLGHGWIDPKNYLLDGILFLCVLPSTVQSSIAFTSIARGNVPAAVCSATLSNVTGIFITPVLVGLFMGDLAKGGQAGVDMHSIESIALQLLLPFILGHLSRPLTTGFITRHKTLVGRVDRSSILLVVYTAFSAAVVEGLWKRLSLGDIALVLALDSALLAIALTITTLAARGLGFSREDEIAIVFCGSKKSLASGVPMAGVLFPPAVVGPLIVPLMLFHQIQLMVCAVMARRYAADLEARLAAEPVKA